MHLNKTIFTYIDTHSENLFLEGLCLKVWEKVLDSSYKIHVLSELEYLQNPYKSVFEMGGAFIPLEMIILPQIESVWSLLSHYDFVLYGKSRTNVSDKFVMCNSVKDSILTNDVAKFSVNDILQNYAPDKIIVIDAEKSGYVMEQALFGVANRQTFEACYFNNVISIDEFFLKTKGITYINKNFIPEKYKNMNEKDFLQQDILLAKIFKTLLEL